MERPINESDRILLLDNLIEKVKKEKTDELIDLLKKEIDFLIESNSCLKDYVIRRADEIHEEYFSYPFIVNKVLNKENFTMVRYQDGEWTCMLKMEPHFTNKISKYGKEVDLLGDMMLDIVKSKPDYYISTIAGSFYERASLVWPFLKDLKNFYVGEVFRRMSVERGLDEFVDALKTRTVVIVGPDWLAPLQSMFPSTHIVCPLGTLFKEEEMIKLEKAVHKEIEKNLGSDPVILYSCSIPAKIMSHNFWNKYEKKITQIDMGAIWDPYCGKKTRPYHEKVLGRINKTKKNS